MSREHHVCNRRQSSTVPHEGPRAATEGQLQQLPRCAVQCSAGEARGKATKEGNYTERGFQGSKADSRRAIWHHCNTTSGMVPCFSDAVPPRLWSTMTEMPKVLRVLRFVWPCPALPAMGPVRDAAASWRGATTSVGCHAGPPWTTDVNAPFVALHSRPLMGRGHASCWPP